MVSSDVVFRMGQCVSLSSSWWSHDVPNQETANYRLQATLCPQPNFVNKVLLKQPFHFISVLLGCFPAITPGLSRCHKDHLVYSDTQSLKQNTYYLALYRKRLLAPGLERKGECWGYSSADEEKGRLGGENWFGGQEARVDSC